MRRFLDDAAGRTFDLAIIGGGITGCAVAYEAVSRGLRACLLEKADFGGATSAATSKLIHGGLRYLKNLELKLVRESLRERLILANIAPNLVRPLSHVLPLYDLGPWQRAALGGALRLYDLLSFDRGRAWDPAKRLPAHQMLSAGRALSLEPGIRPQGLKAAAIYHDCQSLMPERLTLAFLRSAMRHGASAANYARVTGFLSSGPGRVCGVAVRDLAGGGESEIKARLVVNCAGPWADLVLNQAGMRARPSLRRSEGVHIITRPLACSHGVVLADGHGRHLFILPWRGHSLIGTTDEEYAGDPDAYQVRPESVRGLVRAVNQCFGKGDLSVDDVLFAYGGLRPLVESRDKGTYRTSRRYEIFDHASSGLEGLLTVEGGKYTTSRGLAQKVVDLAAAKLELKTAPSLSAGRFLVGCDIPNLGRFLAKAPERLPGADADTALTLSLLYGAQAGSVWSLTFLRPELARRLNAEGEIMAQVAFAVRQEMALTLNDIIFRRTGLGGLGHPGGDVLREVAETASRELGWDRARLAHELARAEAAFQVPGRRECT